MKEEEKEEEKKEEKEEETKEKEEEEQEKAGTQHLQAEASEQRIERFHNHAFPLNLDS